MAPALVDEVKIAPGVAVYTMGDVAYKMIASD
jgi:hypothetical protein